MSATVPALTDTDAATAELVPGAVKPNPTWGEPTESALVLHANGVFETGIWECTPGSWPSARDGYEEVCTYLSGAGVVTDADGTEHVIAPGVTMVFRDGWRGSWTLTETTRKVYSIYRLG